MNETPHLLGIVIRKDGTIPFEADVPHAHREAIRKWLKDNGHEHEEIEGGHFRIKNWSARE